MTHFAAQAKPDGGHSTFKQRYFVCDVAGWSPGGPIFFYVGNEVPCPFRPPARLKSSE